MNQPYNFDPVTGQPIAPQAPYGQPPAGESPQTPYGQPQYGAPGAPAQTVPQTPPPAKPAKPQKTYTVKERVLAWCSALVGYLFCRTFFIWNNPFMGLLFTVCLFAFAFVFFGRQKRKARSIFYPVSALILSAALFFSGSPVLLFFVFTYIVIAFLLFCQSGSAYALEGRAGQLYLFETVKAVFVSPFKNIGGVVRAVGSNKGGKKIGKVLLIILAGIGIAVIPTLIVAGLLSFDVKFTEILKTIRSTVFDKIFARVWSLIFGVPIGMYIFGALYTSAHPTPDSFNGENCVKIENKLKFAPSLVGIVAMIPLLFLYVVFIIAQFDYYKAVFTSTLPDAFTFAEFARDGFFRLCGVAAINGIALILLRVFTKKTKNDGISLPVRISTVVLSLITIVISGTALSQMLMYVSAYGLTRPRLYTLWFMGLVCLIFFVTILKQIVPKLPFAAVSLTVFALCFALLAVPDTDAFIAVHNYNCYKNGTTNEIDVDYLGTLGNSAVPTLCRLAGDESANEAVRADAEKAIGNYAANAKPIGLYNFSLPALRAKDAYEGLDNAVRIRAAMAYDPNRPPLYSSEKTADCTVDGIYYRQDACLYDKSSETVFTNNPAYHKLTDEKEAQQVRDAVAHSKQAFESAGKKEVLALSDADIAAGERFYCGIAYFDSAPTVYLYDADTAALYVLTSVKTER